MFFQTKKKKESFPERLNKRANRNAVLAGFLGWMLDAFDFFILVFVLVDIAKEFNKSVPEMALTITATLLMRPVGALIFGLLADRYGRKGPMMITIVFFSLIEVLSGLAPNYMVFIILRLLYGIGMGGEWGLGASLVMESVPAKRRGLLSGLLQEGYAVGYLLAAVVYYFIFPHFGWRVMFFIGGVPALLTLFIRARVKESEVWKSNRMKDWKSYFQTAGKHWKLFLYLVVLMSAMNLISHGTQDLYPTFLKEQLHHSTHEVAIITMISMFGAILGGLLFGSLSDKWGRRRMITIAIFLGIAMIPLWIYTGSMTIVAIGAFGMQFMVQGAWGIIPAHINELSPGQLRGFFPGFAYQLGVVAASGIAYYEAILAQHLSYSASMAILAGSVFLLGAIAIIAGPEAKGVSFIKNGK